MGHLRDDERVAMSVLLAQGRYQDAVARVLGLIRGTVLYHCKRMKGAVVGGRASR
jgi:DNA-binding CsgD family transcriptional regulator